MNDIDKLAKNLQPHYNYFDVSNRLLFTGHSHQAWPDVALEGLKESFTAAASEVDNKWEPAFEKAEILRDYLRHYYDDPNGMYCLAENTHLLLVSWLSSFDLKNKPKVITTDTEFHSMFRQLHRLEEEGLQIVPVDAHSEEIVAQIKQEIDNDTAATMLSRVYFESGVVNQQISEIAEVARQNNVSLLIDDYHGTNVVPLSLREASLEDCFLLIGGYKYLQWGEGNCFLRFPDNCRLRPAITGWFAAFSSLDEPRTDNPVSYDDGNQRFATGTYDPASQFRAAKVVEFFKDQGLTPEVLRQQYLNQVGLLRELFLERNFDTSKIKLRHNRPLEQNGGFLALQSPFARTIRAKLLEQNIFTDARGDILRLGPAPYTTSDQIHLLISKLTEVVNALNP
ncbi:MAG TPA: aminotransferase class V-fold PLP-dependent enzyme [Balneolaceae bacterium]|nr:aminotransferase class V-fold PLP-dependent enzyme [Balneolaceae bacterium]